MLNLWAEEMQLHERRLIYAAEPHFSIPLMSPGHIWRPYKRWLYCHEPRSMHLGMFGASLWIHLNLALNWKQKWIYLRVKWWISSYRWEACRTRGWALPVFWGWAPLGIAEGPTVSGLDSHSRPCPAPRMVNPIFQGRSSIFVGPFNWKFLQRPHMRTFMLATQLLKVHRWYSNLMWLAFWQSKLL